MPQASVASEAAKPQRVKHKPHYKQTHQFRKTDQHYEFMKRRAVERREKKRDSWPLLKQMRIEAVLSRRHERHINRGTRPELSSEQQHMRDLRRHQRNVRRTQRRWTPEAVARRSVNKALHIIRTKCIAAADREHEAGLEQWKKKKDAERQAQQASAFNDVDDDDEKMPMPAVHQSLDESMMIDDPVVHEDPAAATDSQPAPAAPVDAVMTDAQSGSLESQAELEQIESVMLEYSSGMH